MSKVKTFQPSLFEEPPLEFSLRKYIGTYVDTVDAHSYYSQHKKGTITKIEQLRIDGNKVVRMELDNKEALLFNKKEDIEEFFKSALILTEKEFYIFSRNNACQVSWTAVKEVKALRELKEIAHHTLAYTTIEGIRRFENFNLFSLEKIRLAGYTIRHVQIVKDDFYQMLKEKEGSKMYHINKNSNLETLCGKNLEFLIDAEDVDSSLVSICKRCEKKYNELGF